MCTRPLSLSVSSNNGSPSEDVSISVLADAEVRLRVVKVDDPVAALFAGTEDTEGGESRILALGLKVRPDRRATATSALLPFRRIEALNEHRLHSAGVHDITKGDVNSVSGRHCAMFSFCVHAISDRCPSILGFWASCGLCQARLAVDLCLYPLTTITTKRQ